MPNYLRHYQPGGTFFFTVVTYNRIPILTSPFSRKLLGEIFRTAMDRYPFKVDAICLLPDHLHCIWTLPETDGNFSIRWSFIKSNFSRRYNEFTPARTNLSSSRENRRESGVWQRRFWDHMIRNEEDYERHIDYVHYNPVKHGLVEDMAEWKWSSFHRYVNIGLYPNGNNDIRNGEALIVSDPWD